MLEQNTTHLEGPSQASIDPDQEEYVQAFKITGTAIAGLTILFSAGTMFLVIFLDTFHVIFFGIYMLFGLFSFLIPAIAFYFSFRPVWRYGLNVQASDIHPTDFATLNVERKSPTTRKGKTLKHFRRATTVLSVLFILSSMVFLVLAVI